MYFFQVRNHHEAALNKVKEWLGENVTDWEIRGRHPMRSWFDAHTEPFTTTHRVAYLSFGFTNEEEKMLFLMSVDLSAFTK